MADNYVQIKIKASDDAKPDLTALKFSLDELGAKVETARVDVDDKDAAAKLLALNARLVALDKKVANPRLNAAGAAKVEADIAAVDAALDHLNDKHPKPEVTLKGAAEVLAEVELLDHELDKLNRKADDAGPTGLLGRIIGGAGGALPSGGIGGALLGPAGLAIVPAIGALLVEVVGLASGFAAAGAGAASFGVLAMPAIKQVEAAYTALNAAQSKYQAAQAKYAEDPTKANAKAVAAAKLNLDLANDSMKKLPASEQDAIRGIQGLTAEFGKMSRAFAPEAFKVFGAGLQLVKTLLPDIVPFAKTFADVLSNLLGQAGKFASSKGFADWLRQFHSLEGPALNSIGKGIGEVVVAIGKLLTVMSGKDVAHAINIAFGTVAAVIDGITYAVRRLMQNWDGMSSAARRNAHDVAQSFDAMRHDVSNAFDVMRHFIAGAGHDISGDFDRLRHDAAAWVADLGHAVTAAVNWFKALPGRILSAVGNLGSLLFNAGRAVVEGFIRGIESMIGSIAAAAGHMISSLGGKVLHLLGIGSPSKVAHWWGQMVAQGLADGIRDHAGLPADAAAAMAAGVSGGLRGGGGQGVGGGQLQLQISPGAGSSGLEQQFWSWLKNGVRAQGGDPNMFTRKVAFL